MVKYLASEVRWQDRRFSVPMERIRLTEELGYDVVFSAEGNGSDALTPLGYIAAHTSRLKLGTRILPVTPRPAELAARSLLTLDHMAGGGRVIAGLGAARRDNKPVAEMRQYVADLRAAFDEVPLEKSSEIPLLIAATGPQMVGLAAEIGDGWLPSTIVPGLLEKFQPALDEGFARAGRTQTEDFQTWAHVDMLVDDDVQAAMRPFKEYTATWHALQRPVIEARGYTEMADRLAELVPAGRMEEAVAAVPDDYIDDGWLVGPVDRIRSRARRWLDSELTGLIVRYGPQVGADRSAAPENLEAFRAIAEAAGRVGRS